MARFLKDIYPNGPRRLLNSIYAEPELLYRTHHGVVATPYHRNTTGIMDTIRIFRHTGASVLLAIKARRVDLVLICPGDPEAGN